MKAELSIKIEATDFGELAKALTALQSALSAEGVSMSGVTVADLAGTTAMVAVEASKTAKAGKTAKADKKAEAANDPAPVEAAPVAPPTVPDASAGLNIVEDLSPAEARKRGIDAMQTYFGQNPGAMEHIKQLQKKYGVRMFQDIPDDQAHAFLADAKLLVSGANQSVAV